MQIATVFIIPIKIVMIIPIYIYIYTMQTVKHIIPINIVINIISSHQST